MYGGGEYESSAAAFMGGGFMPSQSTPFPSESSTSIPKNREARCLLPLTIKQIRQLSSTDDSTFLSDGVEVTNVTVVGRVCRKEDKATEYTVLVDDGTGQIECTRWVQEQLDTIELDAILIGAYVRVHGHLRALQSRRFIVAFSIRPVVDFDEIPSHFIECIYVNSYNSKLRGASAATAQPHVTHTPVKGFPGASTAQPHATNTPVKGFPGASTNQSAAYYNSSDGFSSIGQKVMNLLQQPAYLADDNGVHRSVIANQLNIPMNKLMEEIQSLVDNGFIYSTIDDDHFKSTVNG